MGTGFNPGRGGTRGRGGRRSERASGGPVRPLFGGAGVFGEKPDYKTAALCKQVRRLVSMFLSGECGDPVLQSLMVDEVLPAPHAGRMLVRVFVRMPADGSGPGVIEVLERLAKIEGPLRARVGEGIVRKRTPEIAFDVIPMLARPVSPEPEVHDDGQ